VISLGKLRKIDASMKDFTDDELKSIRDSFYELGQLMFEDWHEQKFGSKFPLGSLTSNEQEHTI
jgi:hypothetical protein